MTSQADRVRGLLEFPLFPFEADLSVKPLSDPMAAEILRDGEGDRPCRRCSEPDRNVLWTNGRWNITTTKPTANPVGIFLEPVAHVDIGELDAAMAAEFGTLTWHLERAIDSVPAVGRVHVHIWGDGSSHMHVWFQGRPARQLEMYGWGNVLWSQILEPVPAEDLAANHAAVVVAFEARLASSDA